MYKQTPFIIIQYVKKHKGYFICKIKIVWTLGNKGQCEQ